MLDRALEDFLLGELWLRVLLPEEDVVDEVVDGRYGVLVVDVRAESEWMVMDMTVVGRCDLEISAG